MSNIQEVLNNGDSEHLWWWQGDLPQVGATFAVGGTTYDVDSIHHLTDLTNGVAHITSTTIKVTAQ